VKSSKKTLPAPNKTDRVDFYDQLIATIPGIERKGDANPYTSLNGNMFTLLQGSRSLAIRLPEDKRDEFLKKYKTTLFEAYGAVMKEYVAVPDALLNNTKELQKYLQFSYEYAKTLKPKPTKKAKKRWHEKAPASPVVQRWPGGMSNGKERDFGKMSRLAGKLWRNHRCNHHRYRSRRSFQLLAVCWDQMERY
jgi:TfoX/Sxy family transcriptional regulator of competence genes